MIHEPAVSRACDPYGDLAHYVYADSTPTYMGWDVALCGAEVRDGPEPPRPDGVERELCPVCRTREAQVRERARGGL
jgi:hypothetical protein